MQATDSDKETRIRELSDQLARKAAENASLQRQLQEIMEQGPVGYRVAPNSTESYPALIEDIRRAERRCKMLEQLIQTAEGKCTAAEVSLLALQLRVNEMSKEFVELRGAVPDMLLTAFRESLAKKAVKS